MRFTGQLLCLTFKAATDGARWAAARADGEPFDVEHRIPTKDESVELAGWSMIASG